ncbi:GatB/YqeY domain-containing protein [Panus rudis PR-1116 ss-1]|nr:GatB/YqeY domain-containing protein [Panus rudis PR-1116 ss-1]
MRLYTTEAPNVGEDLRARFMAELKVAMREKNSMKSIAIRSVLADVYAADKKNDSKPIPPSKIHDIVRKAVDRRRDVAAQYQTASRADLAEKELQEASILAEFLPPLLSEEEIDRVLQEVISELNLPEPKADAKPNPKQLLGKVFKSFYGKVDKAAVPSSEYVTRRATELLTEATQK